MPFIPPKRMSLATTVAATILPPLVPPLPDMLSPPRAPAVNDEETVDLLTQEETESQVVPDWPASALEDLQNGWGEDDTQEPSAESSAISAIGAGRALARNDSLIDIEDPEGYAEVMVPEAQLEEEGDDDQNNPDSVQGVPQSHGKLSPSRALGRTTSSLTSLDPQQGLLTETDTGSTAPHTSNKKRKRSLRTNSDSGRVQKRRHSDRITYNVQLLKESDGSGRKVDVRWPKRAPDTVVGRIQEISCDLCRGRVHWSCAGLEVEADLSDQRWYCPPCGYQLRKQPHIALPSVQQDRCLRPDCILRAHQPPIINEGAEVMFLPLKIVGQKEIARDGGRRTLKYLVLWEAWPLCDATWEPKDYFTNFGALYTDFELQARAESKDTRAGGVILLEEASFDWDTEGRLKTERSKQWQSYEWPVDCGL